MTTRARNQSIIAGLTIGVAAIAVTLLPMLASRTSEEPIREIQVVVRDMAFYVDGQEERNPTITLRAGEQVRLRLRNDDPGFRHDFVVSAWGARTRMLNDRGMEDTILFRAPLVKGEQPYLCTPHSEMMRGTIRVE
jgi:plastocyanin